MFLCSSIFMLPRANIPGFSSPPCSDGYPDVELPARRFGGREYLQHASQKRLARERVDTDLDRLSDLQLVHVDLGDRRVEVERVQRHQFEQVARRDSPSGRARSVRFDTVPAIGLVIDVFANCCLA